MPYDPELHHRRSIRLSGYNYASRGAYFLTICVQNRLQLFGDVRDGAVDLNERGVLVDRLWQELERYPGVTVDQYVVMPNHLHGIIWIGAQPEEHGGRTRGSAPTNGDGTLATSIPSLSAVIQRYKTLTTREYSMRVKNMSWPAFSRRLWQTNYFEHIIRDEASLQSIRFYIGNNPARWAADIENPAGDGSDDVETFVQSLRSPDAPFPEVDLLLESDSR